MEWKFGACRVLCRSVGRRWTGRQTFGPMVYTGHVSRIATSTGPRRPECVKTAGPDENNKTNGKRGGTGRDGEGGEERGKESVNGDNCGMETKAGRNTVVREGDITDWQL